MARPDEDKTRGVLLAVSSSVCIGLSFVIKKRGLRLAGSAPGGTRASAGGFAYLRQPLWWAGLGTMVVGEAANFAAYAFAPAAVVTPLGALSILVAALLAHSLLGERLPALAWMGCALCVCGAVPLVLHAPPDEPVSSLASLEAAASRPGFLLYACAVLGVVLWLVKRVEPRTGAASPLVPILICSLVGSLSVLSCKALGTALRLWLAGAERLAPGRTAALACCVGGAVTTQMLYLNKALDAWPTAVVTPLYYALFTTATLAASAALFRDWERLPGPAAGATTACAFGTMLCGVALLHADQLGASGGAAAAGGGGGGGGGGGAALGGGGGAHDGDCAPGGGGGHADGSPGGAKAAGGGGGRAARRGGGDGAAAVGGLEAAV